MVEDAGEMNQPQPIDIMKAQNDKRRTARPNSNRGTKEPTP